jgi:hypothetical protein
MSRRRIVITDEDTDKTTINTENVAEKGQKLVSSNAYLVVLLVLAIIAILAIWLIGAKNGDTFLKTLNLPPGFPNYVIRNIFTTLAILALAIAVGMSLRKGKDFDNTVLIIMFVIFLGLEVALESAFQNREDLSGTALTAPLCTLALGFIMFYAWPISYGWVRALYIFAFIWFLYLTVEFLILYHKNKPPSP